MEIWGDENILELVIMGIQSVNILKSNKLYPSKEYTLWYASYTSIICAKLLSFFKN